MKSDEINLLQLALDRSPDQVFWSDPSGKLIYVNQAARQMLDYSPEQLRTMRLPDLCPGLHVDAWQQHWKEIKEQGQMRFSAKQARLDGNLLDVEVSANHIVFAEEEFACCYVRQITRSIEEQLRLARDAAQSANRAKSESLARLSHEIRTSMNGVIGMAELLRATSVDEQQQEYLNILQASADGLLFLINDILDLARIEAGKLSLCMANLSLKDLFHQIAASQRYMLGLKNLSLQIDLDAALPDQVIGDAQRLKQILLNLLVNAIKFTEQGQIVLRAHLLEQSLQKIVVRMSVVDTGIGLSKEALQRLFTPFEQAETANRFGGSGLGLTICKQLAELHGGKIEVESEVGKGCVFHVTLPFDVPYATAAYTTEDLHDCPINQVAPCRILIAEDNEMIQTMLCTLLQHMGHQSVCCNDGRSALEQVQKGDFDLILMDIRMPVMDGLQTLQHIRAWENRTGRHQPVIAFTANAMAGDREKYLRAGFDGYLSKPLKMTELNEILSQILATEKRPGGSTEDRPLLSGSG